jgi:hypothetical protein
VRVPLARSVGEPQRQRASSVMSVMAKRFASGFSFLCGQDERQVALSRSPMCPSRGAAEQDRQVEI